MLYVFIMSRIEALNSSKTWNVPLCKVHGCAPSLQAPHRTQKEGASGGTLGAAPYLHRVDLYRRIQLDSVLLTASKMESAGEYIMA